MSKTNLNTKNLIKNFESGEVTNPQENGGEPEVRQREHIASVFGLTRKLVSEYEGKKFGDDPSLKRNSLPDDISELRRRGKLNVLIVFAHWERDSFNGALLDTAVSALKEEGHEVVVSDLYRLAFNPLPSKADIQDGPRYPDSFSYITEMGLAFERGTLAEDIKEEQKKLLKADLVIFQFPINWASVPTILKGYFDRVLIYKFSYEYGVWFNNGKFKGKRAILCLTTGSAEPAYSPTGFMGDVNVILWPIQNNILRFCGWDVLRPNICYSPARSTDEQRKQQLEAWNKRVRNLMREQTIEFFPIESFDPSTGQLTKEGVNNSKIEIPIGQQGASNLQEPV